MSLSESLVRSGRKPLVLRGARRVGKTYLVQDSGAEYFESLMTVDLERERSANDPCVPCSSAS
jgi:predicted AAA+ superfamily ATPase